jgi:hypothetical protein
MSGCLRCPECDAEIRYEVLEDLVCDQCGWSAHDDFEENVRWTCESQGLDNDRLTRGLGEAELIDSFLWTLKRDE